MRGPQSAKTACAKVQLWEEPVGRRPHCAKAPSCTDCNARAPACEVSSCKGPVVQRTLVREPHRAQAAGPRTQRETVPSCEVPSCKVPVMMVPLVPGPHYAGRERAVGGRGSGRRLPCPHSVHSSCHGVPVLALEPISDPNRELGGGGGGLACHSWGEDRKSGQLHSSWQWNPVPGFPSPPRACPRGPVHGRGGGPGESSRVHSAARIIQCQVFSSMWPQ